jgi:hypothetical protein
MRSPRAEVASAHHLAEDARPSHSPRWTLPAAPRVSSTAGADPERVRPRGPAVLRPVRREDSAQLMASSCWSANKEAGPSRPAPSGPGARPSGAKRSEGRRAVHRGEGGPVGHGRLGSPWGRTRESARCEPGRCGPYSAGGEHGCHDEDRTPPGRRTGVSRSEVHVLRHQGARSGRRGQRTRRRLPPASWGYLRHRTSSSCSARLRRALRLPPAPLERARRLVEAVQARWERGRGHLRYSVRGSRCRWSSGVLPPPRGERSHDPTGTPVGALRLEQSVALLTIALVASGGACRGLRDVPGMFPGGFRLRVFFF